MRSAVPLLFGMVLPLAAAELKFTEEPIARFMHAKFAGAALHKDTIVAWGDRVVWKALPHGKDDAIPSGGHCYSEGGAVTDVDGDGRPDLILNETGNPPQLVWLQAPGWKRHVIATGVDTRDMLAVTLL